MTVPMSVARIAQALSAAVSSPGRREDRCLRESIKSMVDMLEIVESVDTACAEDIKAAIRSETHRLSEVIRRRNEGITSYRASMRTAFLLLIPIIGWELFEIPLSPLMRAAAVIATIVAVPLLAGFVMALFSTFPDGSVPKDLHSGSLA
jgi:hypothetical protein